jgi:phosphatidylserine decarboxylase
VRVAREGIPFILGALLLTMALGIGAFLTPAVTPAVWAGTLATLFIAYFFRDPKRTAPPDLALVLSAADGRVITIDEVDEPTYMSGRCRRVAIFLSIFDVHVQRSPITGSVGHRQYSPGTYAAAWGDKASEHNERASLGINGEAGRVLVLQIAGLVARRIVTDPEEGDRVVRGQRIGLIRFGSRVEMFLPLEWHVDARVGDRVRAGQTPIARIADEPT